MRHMGADAVEKRVAAARRAIRDGAWRSALDSLSGEEASSSPECLELRAEAAYGAGDLEGCVQSWEDLHSL